MGDPFALIPVHYGGESGIRTFTAFYETEIGEEGIEPFSDYHFFFLQDQFFLYIFFCRVVNIFFHSKVKRIMVPIILVGV